MHGRQRTRFTSGWLAGLVVGAATGAAWLSLGLLVLPLALASIVLIAWKGPRLPAFAGLLTGVGLMWTVLFLRVALTCGGPLDPHTSECHAGDPTGWFAFAVALFMLGLAGSALALSRTQR